MSEKWNGKYFKDLFDVSEKVDGLAYTEIANLSSLVNEKDAELAQVDRSYGKDLALAGAENQKLRKEIERLRNLLEDVVNELDLSEDAIREHGPLGTPPAELVRLVLQEKDKRIRNLSAGMVDVAELTRLKAGERELLHIFCKWLEEFGYMDSCSLYGSKGTS